MKKRILSMLLVIVMVLSLVPVTALAEGYTITSAKKSVVTGEELELTADGAAEPDEVTWTYTSEDGALVEFSATTGKTVKMTGQRQGTVTVKAVCGTQYDEKTYTVYQTPNDLAIIDKDTGIAPVTTLLVGDKLNLDFTYSNMTITKKSFVWGSTDEAVVKVSNTGALEAMGAGDATVTLRFNGGRAELPVHVDTLSATISGPAKMVIGRTQTFTVAFAEGQPVPTEIAWSFTPNDTSVSAEVVGSNGTTATIKATGKGNGFVVVNWGTGSKSVPLEIIEVSALTIQKDGENVTELTLTGRETVELTAVLPEAESEKDVVWTVTSADNAISETHSGTKMTITGDKLGTATVTASIAGDDGTRASNVAITVVGKSTITNRADVLFVGDTHTCVLNTELLDESTFTWESSNPAAATVDAGVVTPVAAGSTTISVKNGETVLDSFTVEVKAQSRIELDPEMPTELLCGQDMTLKAVLKDAEGKLDETASIKWKLATAKADDVVMLVGDKLTALPDLRNPYVITVEAYAVDADGETIEEVESVFCEITVIPTAHQVLLTRGDETVNDKTIKLNVNDPADAEGIEIIAKINPNTADQGVFWSISGDATICTYDSKDVEGTNPASVVVKPAGANKTGVITVTATARTNKDIKAQFTVEFTKLPTTVEILDLEAGSEKNFLRGGDNLTLHTNLEKDSTLTNRRIRWEVTGAPGATIENGVLNTPAVTVRTEIAVTATAEANGIQDTKYITLCPSVASIAITNESGGKLPAKLNFGDGPIQLRMVAMPVGNMGLFEWTSSNQDVATVNKDTGLVTFVDAGTVRITCAALDGSNVKTHVNLIIEKKASSVVISGADELVSGKSTAMTAKVYMDDAHTMEAANQNVIWSVVDENGKASKIASISSRGRLGAKTVSRGMEVTVIARSVENENAYAEFPVVIKPKSVKTLVPYYENNGEFIDGVLYLNPGEVDQYISGQWYDSASDTYMDAMDCTFFSSKTSVASIDSDGMLKTYKKGSATITVRAIDEDTNNVYTAKFTVTVANTVDHVTVKSAKGTTMRSGKSLDLTAAVWSDAAGTVKADNQAVTWEIFEKDEDDTFISTKAASVSTRGRVTANAVSEDKTVFVVATSKENDGLSDVIELTIRPKYAYTITVYKDTDDDGNPVIPTKALALEMGEVGDSISDLHVDVYMAVDGMDGVLLKDTDICNWTTSNKKAVGINAAGDLVCVGKGTAKINAQIKVGRTTYSSNTVTVSLVKLVDEVTVEKKYSGQELYSGKTLLMKATVNADATNKAVKWSFEDEEDYKVASINESTGLIRAKKGLTVQKEITIVATAVDGSDETDSMDVTIYPQISKITIKDDTNKAITKLEMAIGEDGVLTADLMPVEANEKAVKWTSNRSSVVKIDAKTGEIKALRRGTATIKAAATDGSGRYATVKITVVNP